MINLYEHQKLGRDYLLKQKKACLFFEVGTGKTYTALDAVTKLPKGATVLIVAPKKVLENVWLKQTEYDLSDWDVSYINYEKISRDKSILTKTFQCIILDEVHKIKGRTTNTSKRIKILTHKATYVWGLTGTPVANNYADIYNIYKNMDIIEFNEPYTVFCSEYYYVRPLEKGIYTIPILIAPKKDMIPNLVYRIGKHSMTKKAIDCIDLPEKTLNINYIDGMRSKEYIDIENGIFKIADEVRTMIKLEAINKAHQAANGWVYSSLKIPIRIKENKKLDKIYDLCEIYLEETNKIIVVYLYKEDLIELKNKLKDFDCTEDIELFKTTSQILFLQYSQAEGLNLQFCNHMIFFTYDYSFLKFDQMCGRIYRSGQKNNVTYDILINRNTIEEKIWKAIKNKESTDTFLKGALNG